MPTVWAENEKFYVEFNETCIFERTEITEVRTKN